jgi:hypothetical protein
MQDLWKNECQKEELKSVEIWKRKQSWITVYDLLYFDSQCNSQIFQELSPLHVMDEQYHKSLKSF